MTVQQYEIRFMQLSRIAPELVVTEKQRIFHFVGGLKLRIYMDVSMVYLLTFEENLKKAFGLRIA